jgi:hypothetical protein
MGDGETVRRLIYLLFCFSYREFASGFGIYDPKAKAWREDLLKALIPNHR